jgi:hypothetical protein
MTAKRERDDAVAVLADKMTLEGHRMQTAKRRTIRLGICLALAAALFPGRVSARDVTLYDGHQVPTIVRADDRTMTLAGDMLAHDLTSLTGQAPVVSSDVAKCRRLCIVFGRYDSDLMRHIASQGGVDLTPLKGQWERYKRVVIQSKSDPATIYLLIAGSDTRGTIWGVVDLTRELGVSAWEWWADVTPRRVNRLVVDGDARLSDPPSVKYRGIFINDEDWGLEPWAAKAYEPETGNIGPKTYARIFELLWRLKANTIWPAMHPSTKPFYQIPGNAEIAHDYAIVVGSAHDEPMLRNNVREWDDKTNGPFNFFTNRAAMVEYWRQRVEQVKGFENIYTIGLRGRSDSALEGARTPEDALAATGQAIAIQRGLLSNALGRPANTIPQIFIPYKEVLDIYNMGLKVPSDVTLVWPDDNYGYISQLSNAAERRRSGSSGLYYHISYWGRPHDYLWLGTTHPALIREELDRAWQMDDRRLWIVNVGDIKPGEILLQYFLALAFDRKLADETPQAYLIAWAARQFGPAQAGEIASILIEYYDLAFERKPEFMGFGQIEPITPNRIGDFVRTGGDEAHERIDRYRAITARAEAVAKSLPADRQDAFFELVLYPVRASASLNERNLLLDLAALYAREGRASVNVYSDRAKAAHEQIVADTATYNSLGNGKWRGIMNMAPRNLPVFQEPLYPHVEAPDRPQCTVDASQLTFVTGRPATHILTVYTGGGAATWSASGQKGVALSVREGQLDTANGFEQRVQVDYDGRGAIDGGSVTCGGKTLPVETTQITPAEQGAPVEIDHILSLTAASAASPDWEKVPGLGSRDEALRSKLDLPSRKGLSGAAPLTYEFATDELSDAKLKVVAIPVHPLTSENDLRLAVRLDDAPVQTVDYKTFDRSDEWKHNVLTNTAVRTIRVSQLAKGKHQLKIYALDPGLILDRIDVRLDGAPDFYGAPPVR